MTPDEQARLVKLEVMFEAHRADLTEIKVDLGGIRKALDEIVAAANLGRGVWWLLVKLGTATIALLTALAWLYHEFNSVGLKD